VVQLRNVPFSSYANSLYTIQTDHSVCVIPVAGQELFQSFLIQKCDFSLIKK